MTTLSLHMMLLRRTVWTVEWMKSCNIAVGHITNEFVFELMKQYCNMGHVVPCKM